MKSRGASLVELMVAMAAGVVLSGAIASVFAQSRTSFGDDLDDATTQANLRVALAVVTADASMAGYWGAALDPNIIAPDASFSITRDCGLQTPVSVGSPMTFSCIDPAETVVGTDALAVKHVRAGRCLDEAERAAGAVYVAADGDAGLLFRQPPSRPVTACARQFVPAVYFVRAYSIGRGDGIPTLCRKILAGGSVPAMTTECLVEGITGFQVEALGSTALRIRIAAGDRSASETVVLRNLR